MQLAKPKKTIELDRRQIPVQALSGKSAFPRFDGQLGDVAWRRR